MVEKPSVLPGVVAGVIGGAAGATAMVLFNHLLASTGFAADDSGRHHRHHREDAKPNDTDGTISDEPASIKASAGAVERVTGRRLPEPGRRALGLFAHHAFGALAGGLYGAVAARTARITSGGGAPYGAVVWLAAAETGLPLAGLARPPQTYAASRHAASLATHLVFGLTLEAVRRGVTTAWRPNP